MTNSTAQGSPLDGRPADRAPVWCWSAAAVLLLGVLWFIADFPVAKLPLAAGFCVYALVLWRFPDAWMLALPAALPVLDLAPWSGRFFFSSFDALVLLSVAVCLVRMPPARQEVRLPRAAILAILAMTLSYAVSMGIRLFPLQPVDANAFSNYYSSYNALRVGKGFAFALLVLPFLLQAFQRRARAVSLISTGMLVGLLVNGLALIWERYPQVGLFNFQSGYRATGLFSSMHIGGAYLDAYLMATFPFIFILLYCRPRILSWPLIPFAFCLTVYGVIATVSRAPLVGLAVSGGVLAAGLFVSTSGKGRYWMRGGVLLVGFGILALGVAAPFLPEHSAIRQRFATTVQDGVVRLDHWRASLEARPASVAPHLFGMGVGSFPEAYFWAFPNDRPADYQIETESGNRYLRLGVGRPLYMDQIVRLKPRTDYVLKARARPRGDGAQLALPVCEKWLITSWRCQWQRVDLSGKDWTSVEWSFNSGEMGEKDGPLGRLLQRPVKLTLFNSGAASVDVDDVKLTSSQGKDLLQNGDFSHGLDHWFFAVDDHLPWHAKNVFVHLLFEQGWLGVFAFVAMTAVAVSCSLKAIAGGDRFSAMILAALSGLLIIGSIDSLLDDPRTAFLFYLLTFVAFASCSAAGSGSRDDRPHPRADSSP